MTAALDAAATAAAAAAPAVPQKNEEVKKEVSKEELKKEDADNHKERNGEKKEKKEKEGKEGKEAKEGKEKKEKKHSKEEKKHKKDDKEGKSKDKKKDKEKKHKENEKGEKREKDGERKEKKDKKDKDAKKAKEKTDSKDGKEDKEKQAKKEKPKGKLMLKVSAQKKAAKKKAAAKAAASTAHQPKALVKTEDDYEPVNRWWDREDGALSGKRGAKKWDTFEHHGLMYAPEYEPHGIPIKYDGKPVKLDPEAEEVATYFTSVKGSDYETKDIFLKNFWKAFQAVLPKDTIIKDISKCNFDDIAIHREQERQKRLNRTKEEKEALKKKNDAEAAWFAYALINGVREKLGAFKLEPPQLFRGRGEHPKQGLLKKRTFPESVVINIAEDACVPRIVGMPGHAYKDVVHENTVQWIASFEDGLLGETKYVSFAATSGLKGQPDMLKYDRARRLLGCIGKVRESYEKLQTSKNIVERQKATATYFIDKLALRVGGEKNTEEEADTVGCCSLRVEHLRLEPPNTIHFDFLGKDSIRYQNSVQVTPQVYENVESFMKNKTPDQDVFDKVQPSLLNDYFKEFMEDLTAKVFRTYNASFTLQQELARFEMSKKSSYTQDELLKFYNNANRQVAILCNHQKAESKQHSASMQKMQDLKATMEKNIRVLKSHLLALQAGKTKNVQNKLPKDVVSCKKKLAETKMRLDKHITAMTMKEDNKTVSLSTSKVNYMDPRITVAWCKKVDLAIEKVFPRTVRTKFPWAMHFKSSYMFD
mmetsp:Transcript_98783/g.274923  ORF Transcript_98783/g.274923 Transcript_98783/m.274923 type:complete len:762 (+) Transcript_98783:98-2383(+)